MARYRPTLTPQGWTTKEDPAEPQYSRARIEHLLAWVLRHCYVVNGGVVRQQIAGLTMGIAPRCATGQHLLLCRRTDACRATAQHTVRFIDDIFITEDERLPSQESYGMEYSETGRGSNVTYIRAQVYKDAISKMCTCLYDHEEDYVFHIPRYPCRGTVSSNGSVARRHHRTPDGGMGLLLHDVRLQAGRCRHIHEGHRAWLHCSGAAARLAQVPLYPSPCDRY